MGSLKQTKDTLKHCHYLFWNIVFNFHHLFILKLALVSKSIYPFLEFRTIYHIIIIRVIEKKLVLSLIQIRKQIQKGQILNRLRKTFP